MRDKYRGCARLAESEKEVKKTIAMVEKLESIRNVSLLTDVLTLS